MNPFDYERAASIGDVVHAITMRPGTRFIAGGTNLIDLMKEHVERPAHLIDITRLPLRTIEATASGGLRIGALVPNADLAWDARIESRYPLLSRALLSGASPQLRNCATRRPPAAIFCSARAACISMILRPPATSASPARAARRSTAATG